MNDFGKLVKMHLIETGQTQQYIADKLGSSRGAINNALNRDNVSIKQMQAIANALDCDLKIELVPKNE